MERPKWVAIVTGALALILSFGYLLLVQLLDFRGEFKPAPIESLGAIPLVEIATPLPCLPYQHSVLVTAAPQRCPAIA